MKMSGLTNPVISTPPGRSTRNDSRQTGASSGQNTFDTGLTITSKLASGEGAQVAHVAEHGADGQALAGGDLLVPGELRGGVVEHGHVRARRRQHRSLLAAA